ncbi:unnamed protein product, partial [Timema podura]|nr:unnamed protein product [Timema podura]
MSSNAVGCLQEFCMKHFLNMPVYLVTNESGSPHAKTFTVTCQVGNHVTTVGLKPFCVGSGHSKKEAKKIAATSILPLVRGIAVGSSKQLGEKSANSPKELNGKEMENIDIIAAPGSST